MLIVRIHASGIGYKESKSANSSATIRIKMPATHVDRTCSTMKRVDGAQPDESGSGVLSAIRLCPRAGGRLPSPRSGSLRLGSKTRMLLPVAALAWSVDRVTYSERPSSSFLILLRRISLCRATREFSNVQVVASARRASLGSLGFNKLRLLRGARSLPGPRALNDNWAVYGSKLLLSGGAERQRCGLVSFDCQESLRGGPPGLLRLNRG